MRKHLQIALMATPVIAASLSLFSPPVFAADDAPAKMVATTDDSGRTVYTNDVVTPTKGVRNGTVSRQGVDWCTGRKEKRFKPVPSATMGVARSAAAEVNRYLHARVQSEDAARSNFVRSNTPMSQQDVRRGH